MGELTSREEKFVDNLTFASLKEEINRVIFERLKVLYSHFGNISGEAGMAVAFLQGLKTLEYKVGEIDDILTNHKYFRFGFTDADLYVWYSYTPHTSGIRFDLRCNDEFVRKCIENPKYVHKLDEVFDYIEKFLNETINKSEQIKNEIMEELKKTQTFKIVASKKLLDRLAKSDESK